MKSPIHVSSLLMSFTSLLGMSITSKIANLLTDQRFDRLTGTQTLCTTIMPYAVKTENSSVYVYSTK